VGITKKYKRYYCTSGTQRVKNFYACLWIRNYWLILKATQ